MGFLINEKQFINDNIFKFEERMGSSYSRFLDKSPTFVTYYHINNITSMADNGFQSVERILGADSPVRFQMIDDFPVYGLDQILLDLNDTDQGLDTNYDGELIILPNTIKPFPNDIFTINYLDKNYLFMVTQVSYDTIKSNNYYKISFTLNSLDELQKSLLLSQTEENYSCVLENIGTEEKCLIRNDDLANLLKLNEIFSNVALRYRMLFYNTKYNAFLVPTDSNILYDKYMSNFIVNANLFNEKYNYETLMLTNEDDSNTFLYEYETSIYRIIEMRKKDMLKPINYFPNYISNPTSIFTYYRNSSVRSVSFNGGSQSYIDAGLIDRIKTNIKLDTDDVLNKLIIDYFNDNLSSVFSIDLAAFENYDYINYDFRTFITIPIVLFIIRYYYNKFMLNR